ncbi:MAG: hypothetical protein QM723_17905 [Myxococcaceae bacterium]
MHLILLSTLALASTPSPLDETARFLAGKGVQPDSRLAAYAKGEVYAGYSEQMKTGWARFAQPNLAELRGWWKKFAPAKSSTVFYPFSGPDIANALALFPDADTYVLFGLEPPGAIPNAGSMAPDALNDGLNSVRISLDTIFEANFFVTKGMERKLGRTAFNGIAGLLMLFLSLSDCTVTGARKIAVGPESTLVAGTAEDDAIKWQSAPRARVPGVEITFTRAGGKPQVVRYFMLNVDDAALTRTSPNFLPYVKSTGRLATVIKSASYLMHKDSAKQQPPTFDQIRAFVLAQSDFVVEDDSGVPLKYFERDQWKLSFHGAYDAPIPMFSNLLQKDLKLEMSKNSTGKLPFSYGYNRKRGESNLITAEHIR